MMNLTKFGFSGSLVSRAAKRARTAYLEKQRANKLYKMQVKNANTAEDIADDLVIGDLRIAMQLAKDNYTSAVQAYEAVKACPPSV